MPSANEFAGGMVFCVASGRIKTELRVQAQAENVVYMGEGPSQGDDTMDDRQIIELYFRRDPDAIDRSAEKYG